MKAVWHLVAETRPLLKIIVTTPAPSDYAVIAPSKLAEDISGYAETAELMYALAQPQFFSPDNPIPRGLHER